MISSVATPEVKKSNRFGLASLARKAVMSQLRQLHSGCIVLVEGASSTLFGQPLTRGDDLYAELVVHDPGCFVDIMTAGSIGAAESYMTGDWSTPDLTMLIRVMVRNRDILDQMEGGIAAISRPLLKLFHRLNQNNEKGSRRNIAAHYDLGNDLFQLFLDPTMMYSSGIFPQKNATMHDASTTKLRRICEKLQLNENDHLLEVGTGWGGLAIFAAKNYGCQVTTTTISEQQYQLAKSRVAEAGLEHKITLLKEDYRNLSGTYDKLVSIEMIEAVGWQFYQTFFEKCSSLLKPSGVMLIQAITIEDQRYEQAKRNVDFIQRYIFPGSCIPSIQALITASMHGSNMRLVQLEDFAEHYASTLHAWKKQFNHNLPKVKELGYSEEFQRMWNFYLSYCEGGFKERSIGVAHMLFAKPLFRGEQVVLSADTVV